MRITYDPAKISYAALLQHFWRNIDPTVKDRQFCDTGDQYRSGLYYQNEAEREAILASRAALLKEGKVKEVLTEIAPATAFYAAEDYHQDYYKKNPLRYKFYRSNCGRDRRLQELWGR